MDKNPAITLCPTMILWINRDGHGQRVPNLCVRHSDVECKISRRGVGGDETRCRIARAAVVPSTKPY